MVITPDGESAAKPLVVLPASLLRAEKEHLSLIDAHDKGGPAHVYRLSVKLEQ